MEFPSIRANRARRAARIRAALMHALGVTCAAIGWFALAYAVLGSY